jgi:hypothetical protein
LVGARLPQLRDDSLLKVGAKGHAVVLADTVVGGGVIKIEPPEGGTDIKL